MAKETFIEFVERFTKEEKGVSALEWAALSDTLVGKSPSEIAKELGVTEDAIRKRLGEVYRKFGITGRGSGKLSKLQKILFSIYQENLPQGALPFNGEDAKEARQDWGEAPDVSYFYGRQQELSTLKQWLLKDGCRVVAILGIGGIGKTALSVKLAQEVRGKFDYVIWRSLAFAPLSQDLLASLRSLPLNQQQGNLRENKAATLLSLIKFLQQKRCLLILDGWERILQGGEFAGNYQPGFESYGELLRLFAESLHESCLLLTSREKPRQIAAFAGPKLLVQSLELSGLEAADAREIFREKNLSDEKLWDRLIESYRGNPLGLKIIAAAIQNFPFDGNVLEFIKYTNLFLGDIEYLIHEQFERLSELEKEIMYCLAKSSEPVSYREEIPIEASVEQLSQAFASLGRRSLIEKVKEGEEILCTLQPVLRKYVSLRNEENT